MAALAQAGYMAYAIDLPGHGRSSPSLGTPRTWLRVLLDLLKIETPVVVSPSMSGRFALPLVTEEPRRISGFVAVVVALVALGWVKALIMLGAIILVVEIEGHVLQPFLMGHAVSLHPVAVLLSVAAGSFVAGIVGALFAVPIVVASSLVAANDGATARSDSGQAITATAAAAASTPASVAGHLRRRGRNAARASTSAASSVRRAGPSAGTARRRTASRVARSASILRRTRFTSESTLRSVTCRSSPHTRWTSDSRVKTIPRFVASR